MTLFHEVPVGEAIVWRGKMWLKSDKTHGKDEADEEEFIPSHDLVELVDTDESDIDPVEDEDEEE